MGSSISEEVIVVVVISIERWMMVVMEEVVVRLLMVCGLYNFFRFVLKTTGWTSCTDYWWTMNPGLYFLLHLYTIFILNNHTLLSLCSCKLLFLSCSLCSVLMLMNENLFCFNVQCIIENLTSRSAKMFFISSSFWQHRLVLILVTTLSHFFFFFTPTQYSSKKTSFSPWLSMKSWLQSILYYLLKISWFLGNVSVGISELDWKRWRYGDCYEPWNMKMERWWKPRGYFCNFAFVWSLRGILVSLYIFCWVSEPLNQSALTSQLISGVVVIKSLQGLKVKWLIIAVTVWNNKFFDQTSNKAYLQGLKV